MGARQWQPAAGRAVGCIASDQLWHAGCMWTNADMLTRRVPNSRARQSVIYCPLSAGELDGGGGGGGVFFVCPPVLLWHMCPLC